jgi:hypothetical protein
MHLRTLRIFLTSVICVAGVVPAKAQTGTFLGQTDSLLRATLPELTLPSEYHSLQLPPVVDNSAHPYWRPIFNQSSASCGQAAGVAYNFTYEMCRKLNRNAALPEHQFPSHFVYNFMNYNGYYGVNYYHSFEILRTLGSPTIAEYGGMAIDNGNKWISGYEFYRNAMRNRIKKVHRIKTNTVEGLLTLKHWLAHHLEGSAVGGVANFNAASPWGLQQLPQGTPEAGKLAMIFFQGHQATHAMTIVGYNDSIRWDYNGDGLYTNHLDINGDGIVDLLDYEIGAFKVANSYGTNWGNDGYFYMMYRLLAEDVYYGGIWNQQVEVLELNEPYEPTLTMKLSLKHNMREQLRINAGVSADTSDLVPEHRLMFPVFNFQGGPQFMQGGTTDPLNQYIEIGLDLTPLLSFVDSGQPAKFFLEVLENDSINNGSGQIIYFALRDYSTPVPIEIPCQQTNVNIANNALTSLSVVHVPVFNDVQITTTYIPVFDAGHTLTAYGGTPPYEWTPVHNYHQQKLQLPFPLAQQEQLQLEGPNNRFARKTIDFEFPFYGKMYSEIFMHRDGFLLFSPELFPWPYYKDTWLLFKTMKNISAFLVSPIQYYPGTKGADGMWYEGDATHATFRWKKPIVYFDRQIGYGEFALTLFPDGKIEFHYNNLSLSEPVLWYAGVSAGDQTEFSTIRGSGTRIVPSGKSFVMFPEPWPENIVLTSHGYLYGDAGSLSDIHNIRVRAQDQQGLSDIRQFQLSDLIQFSLKARRTDGGTPVANKDVVFDLVLRNLSATPLSNVQLSLGSGSNFFQLFQHTAVVNIPANDTLELSAIFSGQLLSNTPDGQYIPLTMTFVTEMGTRQGRAGFTVRAAEIVKLAHRIQDNDNSRLDPGESALLNITLANIGTANAYLPLVRLQSLDQYITINEWGFELTKLEAGKEESVSFLLTAAANCPIGHIASLRCMVTLDGDTVVDQQIKLKIGQYPLFVFLRSSSAFSSEVICNTLEQLTVPFVFGTSLPDSLTDFRAVMVCLGGVTTSGSLSNAQAEKLVNYLNNGGNLYLEGSTVWAFNRPPLLYEMFSVNGSYMPSSVPATTIEGVEGSFAQGLIFAYANAAVPYLFFQVTPIGNAFSLLVPQNNNQVTVMAGLQTPVYKTIASAIEFGYLDPPSINESRKVLMNKILGFFDLGNLIASTSSPSSESSRQIRIRPNPATDAVWIEFTGQEEESAALKVVNTTGICMIEHKVPIENGLNSIKLGLESLSPGVYFIQLLKKSNSSTAKFVKH